MPVTAANIRFRASTTAGAAGNSTAPGAAGTSLGKYITNADITDASLHNLFDAITGDQNAANQVDYQALFVYNDNATLELQSPVRAWLSAEVAGGAVAAIWVDSTATTVVSSAPVQALTIADKTTAPAASSFSAPTTKGTGLDVSAIPGTFVKAIWVRRTITGGPVAAVDSDGVTIRVEGDTAA